MAGTPIIWITWDEAHRDTLGIFGAGTHQTPAIDSLAACSHHYTNAYTASPVCLPARCSIATGLRPSTTGCLSNHTGGALRGDEREVFSIMHARDYRTAMFGKCHFVPVPYAAVNPKYTQDYEPTLAYYRSLGIDTLVVEDGKCCSTWFYDDWAKAMEAEGLLRTYRAALQNKANDRVFPFPGPEELHPDRWVADQAIRYIHQAGNNEFIWISFAGPHYPQDPPQRCMDAVDLDKLPPRKVREGEWDDPTKLHYHSYNGPTVTEGGANAPEKAQRHFDQAYWDRWQKAYRGNVVMLDECVGDILSAVREKYGNNALIIFTADHGDMSGHHSIWAKNEAAYEDVLRIPLIIHEPGQTEGKQHAEWASNMDLLPTTMLRVFGETISCEGRNVLDPSGAPDHIVSEKDELITVIQDQMKLVLTVWKGETYRELYDLEADPCEFENVYSRPEYQEHLAKLMKLIDTDSAHVSRIFYNDDVFPYWMAPLQPGVPVYPAK